MFKYTVRILVLIMILLTATVFTLPSVLAKTKYNPLNPVNQKGDTQTEPKTSIKPVVPFPVLIDPRNPAAVDSGSLGVDVTFSKPNCPWIRYSFSATRCKWKVKKPGKYAVKCLTGTITSNVDMVIHFCDFQDLKSCQKCGEQKLDTYYSAALADMPIDQVHWQRAWKFNCAENNLFIPKNPSQPTPWNLWNKIDVSQCNSACEYKDRAKITFEMVNCKTWIDSEIPSGP